MLYVIDLSMLAEVQKLFLERLKQHLNGMHQQAVGVVFLEPEVMTSPWIICSVLAVGRLVYLKLHPTCQGGQSSVVSF